MLQLQAGTEANLGESGYRYERHRPGQTLLSQLVEEYYPAFVVQLAAQGTELPEYVRREFEHRNIDPAFRQRADQIAGARSTASSGFAKGELVLCRCLRDTDPSEWADHG